MGNQKETVRKLFLNSSFFWEAIFDLLRDFFRFALRHALVCYFDVYLGKQLIDVAQES